MSAHLLSSQLNSLTARLIAVSVFGSERSLRGADVVSLSVGLWVGGFVGGSLLCSTALLKGF